MTGMTQPLERRWTILSRSVFFSSNWTRISNSGRGFSNKRTSNCKILMHTMIGGKRKQYSNASSDIINQELKLLKAFVFTQG